MWGRATRTFGHSMIIPHNSDNLELGNFELVVTSSPPHHSVIVVVVILTPRLRLTANWSLGQQCNGQALEVPHKTFQDLGFD